MIQGSHHESPPPSIARCLRESADLKVDLWNAFVDSGLTGICDDDCSVIPRILPAAYLPVIRGACRDLMLCLMRLLSLPDRELMAILPPTPITDYLIRELGLFKHRPRRLTGSLRFDMAIVGKPTPDNPPKLLEVNEIGFDGTGRSSFIQQTLLRIVPGLREKIFCLDTAASETRNMRRLGGRLARFQYDSYNWEDELIIRNARSAGVEVQLSSPAPLRTAVEEGLPLLRRQPVSFRDGRLLVGHERWRPDAFQFSYSFELKDYEEAPTFFRNLIASKTPHYSPFFTSLIATKTILAVLSDRTLVKKLVGTAAARRLSRSILPAFLLAGHEEEVARRAPHLVIKHADGMGGERDFIGSEMRRMLGRIPRRERRHWAVQERIVLNTIRVHGILSSPRRVIADLGAYMHYDWNGRAFTRLAAGGFITRATNRSLKVNVSGGGIQVPVMFAR